MDLTQTVESFVNDDQSWLGSAHATDTGDTCTLAIASFDLATVFTAGFIPSGIVIAKHTSGGDSGKYGPYDGGSNEVQSLIATGGTAGDFTLTFGGEVTAAIAFDATAAEVQAALLVLAAFNPGDVVCSGGPLPETAVLITFGGQYAGENVPALVVTDNITDGTAAITTTVAGDAGAGATGLEDPATTRLLFHAVKAKDGDTGDKIGAMLWHGQVIESRLPANNGLDTAAKLGGLRHVDFV
jgi:hypothetical protein